MIIQFEDGGALECESITFTGDKEIYTSNDRIVDINEVREIIS